MKTIGLIFVFCILAIHCCSAWEIHNTVSMTPDEEKLALEIVQAEDGKGTPNEIATQISIQLTEQMNDDKDWACVYATISPGYIWSAYGNGVHKMFQVTTDKVYTAWCIRID